MARYPPAPGRGPHARHTKIARKESAMNKPFEMQRRTIGPGRYRVRFSVAVTVDEGVDVRAEDIGNDGDKAALARALQEANLLPVGADTLSINIRSFIPIS